MNTPTQKLIPVVAPLNKGNFVDAKVVPHAPIWGPSQQKCFTAPIEFNQVINFADLCAAGTSLSVAGIREDDVAVDAVYISVANPVTGKQMPMRLSNESTNELLQAAGVQAKGKESVCIFHIYSFKGALKLDGFPDLEKYTVSLALEIHGSINLKTSKLKMFVTDEPLLLGITGAGNLPMRERAANMTKITRMFSDSKYLGYDMKAYPVQ